MTLERLSLVSLTIALAACSGSSPDESFGDAGGGGATTASTSTVAGPSSSTGAPDGDGGGHAGGSSGAGAAGGGDASTTAATTTATTTATSVSVSSSDASSSSGGGPLPNLRVLTSATSYFDGSERVYFCLNQQPDGDEMDYDDEIRVVNLGDGDAGAYHVALSLFSRITEEVFLCPLDLDNDSGTPASETDAWDGPLCCDFGEVVPGEYHLRVEVDVYDEVAESDENDNVHESGEIYLD